MGIVEAHQPLAIRPVQRQRVVDSVRDAGTWVTTNRTQ
jgi:hypothetical protein